jgi:hypothetical protein
VERKVAELLRLAGEILEEGRTPSAEELARYRALKAELEASDAPWRDRWAELVDRLAAGLEGMGI